MTPLLLPYPQYKVLPAFDRHYHLIIRCARLDSPGRRVFCWLSHRTAVASGYEPCPRCVPEPLRVRPHPTPPPEAT